MVKGIEMLETALIESEKKLEAATKELEDTKNTFQRTLAEYDNYRKRTTKEKADNYNAGRTDAVKAILPMLDTLEMATPVPLVPSGGLLLVNGLILSLYNMFDKPTQQGTVYHHSAGFALPSGQPSV